MAVWTSIFPELVIEVSSWLPVRALKIVVLVLFGKPTIPICIFSSSTLIKYCLPNKTEQSFYALPEGIVSHPGPFVNPNKKHLADWVSSPSGRPGVSGNVAVVYNEAASFYLLINKIIY
jgi:hypothetical protein